MSTEEFDYLRIEKAIRYMADHFREQPSLEELAAVVHLSPFHFQRMFTEWAGVSPKKFLQFTSIEYAKQLLSGGTKSLFDVADETGLSGPSRLHDLFLNIEAMTPGEFKNGGKNLEIKYSVGGTPFGKVLIASTEKGICHLEFLVEENLELKRIRSLFPNADLVNEIDKNHETALQFFKHKEIDDPISLHLKGSPFQLKVWSALLSIPHGRVTTYGEVATKIDKVGAARAVGTAIGSNPIAFLIPCHRVIQSSGVLGGYMWGPDRKRAILGWEASQV